MGAKPIFYNLALSLPKEKAKIFTCAEVSNKERIFEALPPRAVDGLKTAGNG